MQTGKTIIQDILNVCIMSGLPCCPCS